MLFDRFSFRERESGMSEEEPALNDLPTETRSYAFTLDTRQIVFLIAGYCFLCVLVFALGMVVGRATGSSETVAKAEEATAGSSREQSTPGRPDLATSGRIPLLPATESRKPEMQGPEFAFSSNLPEYALPSSKSEGLSTLPTPRPRPAPMPEVASSSEPPAVPTRQEDTRDPEPRRPASTAESKPKAPTATRTSLSQGGDYTIQVSSSRSLQQATELKGRLSKKGYTAYIQSVDLNDKGTWHRVRIGNYRDKDGAERVASDLRSRESLPATVMKR